MSFIEKPKSMPELMTLLNWSNRTKFREKYIKPLIEEQLVEMSHPDKPSSSIQQYQLSEKGKKFLNYVLIWNQFE